MPAPSARRIVTQDELRRRFNHGRYRERARAGEFRQEAKRDRLARPSAGQPPGTRSQYSATDEKGAVVHQYPRPDGQLGGSGPPDPQWLVEDGVEYYIVE
jgi:hypothetical protein